MFNAITVNEMEMDEKKRKGKAIKYLNNLTLPLPPPSPPLELRSQVPLNPANMIQKCTKTIRLRVNGSILLMVMMMVITTEDVRSRRTCKASRHHCEGVDLYSHQQSQRAAVHYKRYWRWNGSQLAPLSSRLQHKGQACAALHFSDKEIEAFYTMTWAVYKLLDSHLWSELWGHGHSTQLYFLTNYMLHTADVT